MQVPQLSQFKRTQTRCTILYVLTASLACFAAFAAPAWNIGPNLQYQWGGTDYLPIGVQAEYSSPILGQAKQAGLQNFNVEIPLNASWREACEQLAGTNYFLTLNTAMPAAKGFIIQPQHYRIANIQNPTTISVNLPGATKAYVAVALRRDLTVISEKLMTVENGVLRANVKATSDTDQVVYIYPLAESLEMEDLWDRLDERRDMVIKQFRQMGAQPGLRGIINPLGTTPYLASQDSSFVPTSVTFQREFADFLEQKYRNINTLVKAWQLRGFDFEIREDEDTLVQDRTAFALAAKLVPLWNGQKGLPLMLDPATEMSYSVETKKSMFWSDLAEAIAQTRARRVHRIVRSLRKEINVPLIQEWNGWSWFFEAPECEFNGLSTRLSKLTPSGLVASLSSPLSSSLRIRNSVPLLATDVPIPSEGVTQDALDTMSGLGVRGAFFRVTNADQLGKLKTVGGLDASGRPKAFFYPQNAFNPIQPRLLGGATWLLPSPADGNRIDLGPEISCYSVSQNGVNQYVLWTDKTPGTFNFRFPEYKTALIKSMGGIAPTITANKDLVQIPIDSVPLIILGASAPPVPDAELTRLKKDITQITEWADAVRKDVSTEVYDFRQFDDQLKYNPYQALQLAQRTLKRIGGIAAGGNWGEWELSSDNLFSEVVKEAGCSNGAYLSLKTPLGEATGAVYATLGVPQRSTGALDVWLAAKIPSPQDRARMKVKIAGQTLQVKGEPVGVYGSGFGWYNLGQTRLPSNRTDFRVEITGISSTEVGLDVLCLSPQPFIPNNVSYPAWTFPTAPNPPKKGSGG